MVKNEKYFYFNKDFSVPAVLDVLRSKKKIIVLYGWRDGGKSTSFAKILVSKLMFDAHFRGVHVRKHYNEIQASTFQNLSDRVKELGLSDYVGITKDHFKFTNLIRPDNFIFGAGADNPDKIRSTQDLNYVWFEEFHDATQQDFESIMGTIRERPGIPTCFIATLNNDKVIQDSFIDKYFFQESSPIYDKVERIHVTWKDNQFIDKEATEEKLRTIVFGDTVKYDLLNSGAFLSEGDCDYYAQFNNGLLDESLDFDAEYPILLSFDFNYNPTTCVFMQDVLKPGGGLHVLKEIQKDGGTMELIKEVKMYLDRIGWSGGLRITGDASGHKHDTRSGTVTDFDIIQHEMKIPKSWITYNVRSNMALGMSKDIINNAFYHGVIKFKPSDVPGVIKDIRIAKRDDKSLDDSAIKKDRENYKMDLLDAFRYGVHLSIKSVSDVLRLKAIYNKK